MFLVSTISQLGDILISFFKRLSKIKDMVKLFQARGLLDRVDGMIFAFLFHIFFYYLIVRNRFYEKKIAILGSTGSIGKI